MLSSRTPEASDDRDGNDTVVAEDLAAADGFDEPAGSYAVAAE